MQKDRNSHDSEIITREKTLGELKDIEDRLLLKNLYSLLGCARGLLKSQKQNLTGN